MLTRPDSGPERWTIASFVLRRALFVALLALLALLFVNRASVLASSFIVNSSADAVDADIGDGICQTATPGECTLRAAVQQANAWPGDDAITLPAGTYVLTLIGGGENGGVTGDLDHRTTDQLTITGAGSAVTTISAAGLGDRIFEIANGSLALRGVTLTGGSIDGNGGAISLSEAGTELLGDVIVTGNSSTANGGGVDVGTGNLSIVNSTISNNQAGDKGGGLFLSFGDITIENSSLSHNTAPAGEGLYLQEVNSAVTLLDTSIADNIYLIGGAQLILDGATGGSIDGVIAGDGTIDKRGTGTYTFSNWNTYAGPTTINQGILRMTHPLALGWAFGPDDGTTVAAGATLEYKDEVAGLVYYTREPISLNGDGVDGLGAMTFRSGAAFQGPITLATDSSIGSYSGPNVPALYDTVSGPGSLKKLGPDTLMFSSAMSYSGATIIQEGSAYDLLATGAIPDGSDVSVAAGAALFVGGPFASAFAIGPVSETIATLTGSGQIYLGGSGLNGTLTVGNGTNFTFDGAISDYPGGDGSLVKIGSGSMILTNGGHTYSGATTISDGTLRLLVGGALPDSSAVTVNTGGTLDLNDLNDTVGSLAGGGNVILGSATLTSGGNNGSTTYSGVISGSGGLIKTGAGTLTLAGNNSYSGLTNVQAGRLNVNGAHAGNVTVTGGGAALGGAGTINGTVSVATAGFLSPGNSPGILNAGDTTLAPGSTFEVEITGNTPGVGGYDQLNITGSVVIGTDEPGVTLATLFPPPAYTPVLGDQYVIIENDGEDPVTGIFAGLSEGAVISPDLGGSGYAGVISYAGGSGGNDVVISVIPGGAGPQTFVVNTTADTNDGVCDVANCSLREALDAANAHVNAATPDAIHFNIPGAGPHTVQPAAALPTITEAVTIDGSTNPTGAIVLDSAPAGSGVAGLTINGDGSTITGLTITGFDGAGVAVLGGTGNVITANSIYANGGLGIDLGGDGVTKNDFLDADAGPNDLQNAPIIQRVYAATGGLRVQGTLNSQASTAYYRIELFANATCDRSFYGEGQTPLNTFLVTTNSLGNAYFSELIPMPPDGVALVATATKYTESAESGVASTSEFSRCAVVGPNNDTWANAYNIPLNPVAPAELSGAASQFLSASGQTRWFKFPAASNSTVIVDLVSMPANYDLTLFRDIAKAYDALRQPANVDDLAQLSAEFAPEMFTPEMFTPEMFTPEMFTPEMFTPEMFTPEMFTPEMFTPEMFTPEMFTPEMFTPEMFTPDQRYYAGALAQSAVAVSGFDGTAPESVVANTWNESGEFYVSVKGRNGAYDPTAPFDLRVTVLGAECNDLDLLDATPVLGALPDGDYTTLFLVDSQRMGTDDYAAIASKLDELAVHPAVNGVIVDVSQFSEIAEANAQADTLYQCVYAKNIVAYGIKAVVDAYRAAYPTLRFIVPVGNDDVIPFFRYPDQALLANESGYVPPVLETTASQASLRNGYLLTQDTYGASIELQRRNTRLPIPELAVGRLVETPDEINATIQAFLDLAGTTGTIPTPTRALVTGYDFLADAATAIEDDLAAGLGANGSVTTLIDAATVAPANGWSADELRTVLMESGRHDLMYLGGHFSSFSALAADHETRVLASELLDSSVDMRNAIIFSNGCHSGYNLVSGHAVPNVSIEPDWAQVFAAKGAVLIAGTGYQYGDTDFTEYGERLYYEFSRELRRGSGPVSVGEALVRAKQVYLSETVEMRPIHEKTLLIAALFGLPMTTIDMPGARYNPPPPEQVTPAPVTVGPGSELGLATYDLTVAPDLERVEKPLQNIVTDEPTDTVYYRVTGSDRLVINPGEPILPLDLRKFQTTDRVVRGLGFRGGSYVDDLNVIPLTGAATTELRGIHTPFISNVFYPITPWDLNYFDVLANSVADGAVGVGAIPAQYRSNGPASVDGTMRVYNSMAFRLFYSDNTAAYENVVYDITNIPALAGPPVVAKVLAETTGSAQVAFRVTVTGDPSAGIQAVWVTYTSDQAPLAGQWQSLDLTQDPLDSRDWIGTLDLQGTSAGNLRYMVQAVNGAGLVSLSTNMGAYFTPDVDPATPAVPPGSTVPPAPVELELLSPPSFGDYGTQATFAARLTSNGAPLAQETLEFGLTSQRQTAVTGPDGVASVSLTVIGDPVDDTVRVTYPGAPGLAPAAVGAPFTIRPIATILTVLTSTPTFSADGPADLAIALTDASPGNRPQPYKTVLIVVENNSGDVVFAEAVQTDLYGAANLRTVSLTSGSYQVRAFFAGRVTLPGIGTIDMRLPRFAPIETPAAGEPPIVIRTNTPPEAEAGGPYEAVPGGSVTLDALASSDADAGQALTYAWDFDSDGEYEVQGPTPTFSAPLTGPQSYTVRLRVCDPVECSLDTATITIRALADTIAPTASPTQAPAANGVGWNNGDVAITWNWTDNAGGSGIDFANCTTSSTSTGEGNPITLNATCKDVAGNTGNASYAVKVDKTKPTLSPVVSPNPVLLNGTATVTSGAADALSGLASQSCGALVTNSVGAKSVTCTATDNAGNSNSATVTYNVNYNFSGFFHPVNNLPTFNQVNAGRAIPVKFSLAGNQGLSVFATGYPTSQRTQCNSSAPMDPIEVTVTAGASSLSYDAGSNQYTYVWATNRAWVGTCRQLIVRLIDGTEYKANFRFN